MGKAGRFGKYGDHKRMERLRWKVHQRLVPEKDMRRNRDRVPLRKKEPFRGKEKVKISRALLTDLPFIKELSRMVFAVYGEYDVILEDLFLFEDIQTFLVCKEQIPLGFAMLSSSQRFKDGMATAELVAIAVIPEYQGRHLGMKLLKKAEDLARKMGAHELCLHVAEGNEKARTFFHRSGFEGVRSCPSYYPKGQHAVEMLKRLG